MQWHTPAHEGDACRPASRMHALHACSRQARRLRQRAPINHDNRHIHTLCVTGAACCWLARMHALGGCIAAAARPCTCGANRVPPSTTPRKNRTNTTWLLAAHTLRCLGCLAASVVWGGAAPRCTAHDDRHKHTPLCMHTDAFPYNRQARGRHSTALPCRGPVCKSCGSSCSGIERSANPNPSVTRVKQEQIHGSGAAHARKQSCCLFAAQALARRRRIQNAGAHKIDCREWRSQHHSDKIGTRVHARHQRRPHR